MFTQRTSSGARHTTRWLTATFFLGFFLQANAAPEPDRQENLASKIEATQTTHQSSGHPGPLQIGSATQNLLQLQRNSAGQRPRPIDGEQASRSYQRYLKSFETAIPERFDTGMDLKKQ